MNRADNYISKIDRIVTEREYQTWASWHVVYEWEDIFIEKLHTNLCYLHGDFIHKFIYKTLGRIPFTVNEKQSSRWRIGFIMGVGSSHKFKLKNMIPIYLDVMEKDIDILIRNIQKLPCFFVTALDTYEIITEKLGNNTCYYIPLSVSDKYCSGKIPYKDIDVIQLGRKNDILHGFMIKYCEYHPEIDYVYQTADGTLTYISTKNGNMGKFDSRDSFMKMLGRSKVSLVSTPSIDNKENTKRNFGKIDFFTPRFYESASQYCHMIGRYTKNRECEQIGISDICMNVSTYDQFAMTLDSMLEKKNDCNVKKYEQFLKENSTSNRVDAILNVLKKNNFCVEEKYNRNRKRK